MNLQFSTATAIVTGVAAAPTLAADDIALLPAGTECVAQVKFKEIFDSDLYKRPEVKNLFKQVLETADQHALMKKARLMGIEIEKNVVQITVSTQGIDMDEPECLIILRGKFDRTKFDAVAANAGHKADDSVSVLKAGDETIIKIKTPWVVDRLYIAMADEKLILISSDMKILLTALKASRAADAKILLKPELQTQWKSMDSKATLSICNLGKGLVSRINQGQFTSEKPEEFKAQLESAVTASLTIRVTGDLEAEAILQMKSDAEARDFEVALGKNIERFKSCLPIILMQQPAIKPLVRETNDSLKLSRADKTMKLSLKWSGPAIQKTMKVLNLNEE